MIDASGQGQPKQTTENDVAVARVMGCALASVVIAAIISMTVVMVAYLIFLSDLGKRHREPVEYSAPY
jgi:hypothetical protein